jgi:integrase
MDEWLRNADIETSTRDGYVRYIERVIRPVLGDISVNKLGVRDQSRSTRRCRAPREGRPFIVHATADEHDCVKAKCKPRECKPLAASTVRQIHSIISGVLNAAGSAATEISVLRMAYAGLSLF